MSVYQREWIMKLYERCYPEMFAFVVVAVAVAVDETFVVENAAAAVVVDDDDTFDSESAAVVVGIRWHNVLSVLRS